jgi:hypothetical protein
MWAGDRYQTTQLIQQIETIILQAERLQRTGQGDRLYLTFWPRGGRKHRSEVFTGALVHERGSMRGWGETRHAATLQLTRAYFWEEVTELEIPLSINGSEPSTSGVTVQNDYDAGTKFNYVHIDGDDIVGNLPADVRILLVNGLATLAPLNFYIGRFAYPGTTVNAFIHTLQGESMTSTVGGTVADATSSAGAFNRIPLTPTLTQLGYWDLTAAMCNALNGGLVQLMVRFGNTTDFTTKFPRLWFSVESVPTAGYGFLRTPDVGLSGRKLEAMGTVAIPPTLPGLSGDTAYNLKLFGYSSEAVNVDLDYVQLFPVEAFRSYQMSQRNWIASGDWQDDGYRVFVESSR